MDYAAARIIARAIIIGLWLMGKPLGWTDLKSCLSELE